MLVPAVTGKLPGVIENDERLYEGGLTFYFQVLFFRSSQSCLSAANGSGQTVNLPPRQPAAERRKYASGLFNMMRNLDGAGGFAMCGAILNSQTNFHFNMSASNLTSANGPMDRLIAGQMERYRALPGSLAVGPIILGGRSPL